MAFDINTFVEQNTKKSTSGFDAKSFVTKYTDSQKKIGGFDVNSFVSSYGSGSSKNLKSSTGLYNLAVQSGLKNQADRILASQQGEETKKIFSGGFISDTFDVLNALDYGVVGMLKGKTFEEGVKTRQSFTDKDSLGSKGIPGIITGTLLDIAVDPLTYIAPATIVKKIPFASKLLKGAKEFAFGKNVVKTIEGTDKTYSALEGGTKIGNYLAEKFKYMNGADPVFRETFERSVKNVAISTQATVDLGKSISKLNPITASKILKKDETGRFIRTRLKDLQKILTPEEIEPVAKLYSKLDSLGKEAVDLGLLSKEKYEETLGEYIKNAYSEYELAKGKGFGFTTTGVKGIKKRVEELTPEKMKELGQIDNPAYLLFKSVVDLTKDVENAKMLKIVGEKFGTDVAQEGFTKIPTGIKYASLGGKYIPDNMASYLREIIEPVKDTLARQAVANFKFAKVILNPGTHARNIISNKLLNYWKLGMNPLDPRVIANDIEALKEISKGTGKYIEEAKPLGYNVDTFASAEMKNLLETQQSSILGKGNKNWQTIKKKLGDLYQNEENHAKLSAYIWNRKKGFSPEEAWKAAESATFNYAQVTPFVRKLRTSLFGFPFITFTVKSTPLALETMYKNPARVSAIGKIKQSIENLSDIKETDRERKNEPSWVKQGFYIKLPMKDKEGRSAYFDLTYILPFGDIMSGNFLETGQNMETGLPESQITSMMKKSPFIQMVGDIYKNKNFYGNKIWKESDPTEKQLKDLMIYITKTVSPPLIGDQLPNGYNSKGEVDKRGIKEALTLNEKADQKRNLTQELLRNIGAKIQPIDADIQETYTEWNKKKALQKLLLDNGLLDELNITYKPK